MCSDLSLPCPFAGDRLAGAPQAHALDTRLAQAVAPGQERDHARAQARAALRRLLAAVLGCAPQALSVSDARGIPPRLGWTTGGRSGLDAIGLSISHAPGLSLVAWCPKGAVGVDVQAVPYATDRAELWRTAALFFHQTGWKHWLSMRQTLFLVKRSRATGQPTRRRSNAWARAWWNTRPRWRRGWPGCARRPSPCRAGPPQTWWPPSPGAPNRHAVQIAIDAICAQEPFTEPHY